MQTHYVFLDYSKQRYWKFYNCLNAYSEKIEVNSCLILHYWLTNVSLIQNGK